MLRSVILIYPVRVRSPALRADKFLQRHVLGIPTIKAYLQLAVCSTREAPCKPLFYIASSPCMHMRMHIIPIAPGSWSTNTRLPIHAQSFKSTAGCTWQFLHIALRTYLSACSKVKGVSTNSQLVGVPTTENCIRPLPAHFQHPAVRVGMNCLYKCWACRRPIFR